MTERRLPQTAVENLVEDLALKANADLSNLDATGQAKFDAKADIALTNSPYTTNRILEIPQDIKLELNNGTLTLKAGSKVYVPNGPDVFDKKTTSSDLTLTNGWGNQQFFVYLDINNNICIREVNFTESGSSSSLTSQYRCWYDTTNNSIKWTDDTGSTWREGFSFPIALITTDASSIISIDQVFNGFGYIGSTVFALPGVKVQIPYGRNADGTLKSIEYTNSSVRTNQEAGNENSVNVVLATSGIDGNIVYDYDEKTNYCFRNDTGAIYKDRVIIGKISVSSGRITSLKPYTVDSILNSNLSNLSAAGQAKFDAKANIDLNNLSTAGQAIINGKADINASNFTATGKQTVVGWVMPGYFSKPRVALKNGVWNYADKNIIVTNICIQNIQGEIYINTQASDAGAVEASSCVSPASGGKSSCQAFIRKGIYYKAVFNSSAWYDELMEG